MRITAGTDNTVNVEGQIVIYDGQEYGLKSARAGKTGSTLQYSIDGTNYSETEPKFSDAETYTVYVKATNPNYADTEAVTGKVVINKRQITITADSASKVYDGTALKKETAAITSGTLAPSQTLAGVTVTGSQTNVGTGTNTASNAVIKAGSKPVTDNYQINYQPGTLRITAGTDNTVNVEGQIVIYDGQEYGLKSARAGKTGSTLQYSIDGTNYSETEPKFTDAGTYTVHVKATNPNYADTEAVIGTVVINKRPVSFRVNSQIFSYTGDEHEVDYIIDDLGTDTGLLEGHEEIVSLVDAKRTEAGSNDVLMEDVKIYAAEINVSQNYDIQTNDGTISVIAATDNAVNVIGQTVTYDGAEHGLKEASALREGSTILYSTDGKEFGPLVPVFADAGTYKVYVKATNPNYETVVGEGTVIINKRNITVTAGSASKTYDATPLINNSATVTLGNIVDGQTWTVKVNGSQTAIGTSQNIASGVVIKEEERDVTDNYNISYVSGNLTVTSAGGGNNSSGGGGGGGGSTPNPNRPLVPGGPGTVTINPDQIPLANLPGGNPADELIIIDDNQIPLAGLPKTGDRNMMPNLAAIISGVLLAAYAMITGKKKEEN